MKQNLEIEKALKELEKLTGLPLSINIDSDSDIPGTIQQIHSLCTAYREKHDKNLIMKKILTGEIPQEELFSTARRLHINPEENRVLLLIDIASGIEEAILSVLKNIFPHRANPWLVPIHKTLLALVYTCNQIDYPQLRQTAHEILNTLNTEALVSVHISYSNFTTLLEQLPDAYQQAYFAMEVGRAFYSEQTVYGYDKLGIGRLLYRLPRNICEDYIRENIGEDALEKKSPVFQSDTLYTVNCFLHNNLNIAETARQLHMHRNTLLYRLEQIQNETGLDIRNFDHAMTFKIASMLINYIN